MPAELLKMSDQFQGLPMESLIGGPLQAAANAQVMLARSTADFINVVGFNSQAAGGGVRNVRFEYEAPRQIETAPVLKEDGTVETAGSITNVLDVVHITVPLLAVVPTPNLQIDTVDVTFDMEVKSSFSESEASDKEIGVEAEASGSYGPFSFKAKVHGKASTHQETTRSSDNSAKYHVAVHATNHGMPEGLKRVMDMMASAVAPRAGSKELPIDGKGDVVRT